MKNRFNSLFTACLMLLSLFTYSYTTAAAEVIVDNSEYGEMMLDPEDAELYSNYMFETVKYNSSEKTYLYYDQLDKNNKTVYDEMKKWLDPVDTELIISFPEDLTFIASSPNMKEWSSEEYKEFWNMLFRNMAYGERAVLLDYPEMFWFNKSPIKVSIGTMKSTHNFLTGEYTLRLTSAKMRASLKDEYEDFDTALEFKELLEESIRDFEVEGADRYQQIKYIHDYICNNVEYDIEAPYLDSAVGVFCEPYRVVCEGYVKAFKLICDKFDIPCVSVPGNIDPSTNNGHIWNYVMMEDGKWYGIDCTWDDTDSVGTGIKYEYFLKGSESFSRKHRNEAGLVYPELSEEDYVYKSAAEETTVPTEPTAPAVPTETIKTTETAVTTETEPQTTVSDQPVKEESGDYNNDGVINLADVVLLRRYIVNKISDSEQVAEIDLNGDGRIDVLDCIILTRNILGGA